MIGGFVAGRVKEPILALDDDEARVIAEASANVAKHYNVPVTEKTAAWIGLCTAIGTVYGSKIAAIRMANAMKPKQSPTEN